MLKGKVIRAAGGFFAVSDDTGKEYFCRARGVLKRDNESLMVGDIVLFEPVEQEYSGSNAEGVIEKCLPRSNQLERPPVANIDQLVVVMSLKHPECDWQLVSRLLIQAEKEQMTAFLCLNKADLVSDSERESLTLKVNPYPYEIVFTSALEKEGVDRLSDLLKDCCSVFAGPSGAGKSSLLNSVQPGLSLQTGEVSEKIKRGRHTTRQAELLPLSFGGTVVDTPGFSRLSFTDVEPESLANYFPELEQLRGNCNFRNCRHAGEPGCAVEDEVGNTVNPMRYEHYKLFLEEINRLEAY